MKNEVVLASLIFIIVLSSFVLADTNATSLPTSTADDSSITKAYQCINSQLSNKTSFSLQEAVFGQLALGFQQKLQDVIDNQKSSSLDCWPKAGCNLKDTAQVLLLYDRLGKDTAGIKSWLLSRNASMTDLDWYLEADISKHVSSTCTVKYDSTTRNLLINNDMTLSATDGDLGGCLSISGYWMKINPSSSCYSKTYQISCSEDFVSTLLYTKTNDATTVYVSSSTHSAPSSGTTSESINARCFKNSANSCDYEGSLWAALALQKSGVDVSSFTPYLIALAQDNTQIFPYSFIYMVSGGSDQFDKIVQAQKQNQYWEAPSTRNNKYYDSALAMLAISGSADNALDNAKNYFKAIQSQEGCWNNNNFKDTSFLLYSGWPKDGASAPDSGSSSFSVCESTGSTRSCEFSYACAQAGGSVQSEFICNGAKSCCSIKIQDQSCSSKSGKICLADEQCSGSTTTSSEGASCCLGSCDKIVIQDTCTVQSGGSCKSSCSSSEERVTGTCSLSSNVCCKAKQTGISSWLIWLLIILIILISLAILYKDKLIIYWYKFNAEREQQQKKQQPTQQRFNPALPPRPVQRMSPLQRPVQRQPIQRPSSAQVQRQSPSSKKPLSQSEKELEETLKKLRDMSK